MSEPRRTRRVFIDGQDAWNRPGAPVQRGRDESASPDPHAPATAPPAAQGPAIRPQHDAEQRARGERDAREQVERATTQVAALDHAFTEVRDREVAGATRRAAEAADAAEAARESATTTTTARYAALEDELVERLSGLARDLAAGEASTEWARIGTAETASVAGHVRIGTVVAGGVAVPALAPLTTVPGWYVTGRTDLAEQVVLGAVLRLVAQAPLKHLRIDVFDPRIRGAFGRLAPVRGIHHESFPVPATSGSEFADRLRDVLRVAARNAELTVTSGVDGLADLWTRRGSPAGTLQLVVVLDYPFGIDQQLQALLAQVAATTPRSGTALLVVAGAEPPATGIEPSELSGRLLRLDVDRHLRVAGFPEGPEVHPDPPPSDTDLQRLVARVRERADDQEGPVVPFASLHGDDLAQPWTGRADRALDVVLGLVGDEPLTLSIRTENPPLPNLIVGGAVGQGKSNLLLNIIYGLALRYSPEELELQLLDFKRGLEFRRFDADEQGRHWLPHVSVLGLESNHAFGVAVLRDLDAEMERRAEVFKESGVSSIDGYRTTTGLPMPRLLLIVDEFHVLFEGEREYVDQCVDLTAQIAKQGRAYGIHLLFASQTMSGLEALAVKGSSIFGQFPLRISLKNTVSESETVLSQGNHEAAELTYRGEVVVNRNFGALGGRHGNERGIVGFADDAELAAIQRRLWETAHGRPPAVFLGRSHAPVTRTDLDEHRATCRRQPFAHGLTAWLGRPIAVTADPFVARIDADADQALAIVGPDETTAHGVLQWIATGAAHELSGTGRIVVLDGASEIAWTSRLLAHAAACDVPVELVPREDVARYLREDAATRLDEATPQEPVLLVAVGLQRVRGMTHSVASDSDDLFATPVTARHVLSRIAREGGPAGMFLVGWWNTLASLESDLGMGRPGVGTIVTAKATHDDLRSIAGPFARPPEGTPRIGVYDGTTLHAVVPFAPSDALGGAR